MSFRDSPFNDLKVPLAWTAALALVVALVVAVALLVSDRRETLQAQAYGAAKSTVDMVQAPISGVLAKPVRWTESGVTGIKGYFFAVSQNRKLRKENDDLRRWRDTALALQDVNDRYKAALGLKTDPPVPMATGVAVTDSRGPFANSRLINVGKEKGITVGNPVMSENGLVGRIVGVTRGASRLLLLTDVQSKTPVMVDRTNARAILTGDGGPNPRLDYLRGREPVKVGDRIVTSGDGGVFPRGLPIGVAVKGLEGAWRVQLASDYAPIDIVRVLEFQDFSKLVNEAELSAAAMPPAPASLTAPPPSTRFFVAKPGEPARAAGTPAPAPNTAAPQPKAAAPKPGAPKPAPPPAPVQAIQPPAAVVPPPVPAPAPRTRATVPSGRPSQ